MQFCFDFNLRTNEENYLTRLNLSADFKSQMTHIAAKQFRNADIRVSWPTSGPEFCEVSLRKMPASGWGSLWESPSFTPWFSTFVFRNVPGTVPECVRICGIMGNSSNLDRAPKMRDSVLLNSWDSFFSDSAFNLLRNLCDIFLVNSWNGRVLWLAVPRMFFLCFSCNGCQSSFVSQCCHLFDGKMLRSYENWISFLC